MQKNRKRKVAVRGSNKLRGGQDLGVPKGAGGEATCAGQTRNWVGSQQKRKRIKKEEDNLTTGIPELDRQPNWKAEKKGGKVGPSGGGKRLSWGGVLQGEKRKLKNEHHKRKGAWGKIRSSHF